MTALRVNSGTTKGRLNTVRSVRMASGSLIAKGVAYALEAISVGAPTASLFKSAPNSLEPQIPVYRERSADPAGHIGFAPR